MTSCVLGVPSYDTFLNKVIHLFLFPKPMQVLAIYHDNGYKGCPDQSFYLHPISQAIGYLFGEL